ncbi:MAG: hypothetical protein KAT15_25010, partial [Bacteroidales bacterium]|nr:hypothetical protein [Bacteroidales bacterium]
MRGIAWVIVLFLLAGCTRGDLSWISIRNDTGIPIYALPYSSDFIDGEWIQPGVVDDFYSINCDCLDGYAYFSFYYDSLIIYLEDHDDYPIKFYQDGTTVNYDPTLNPFVNPEVWKIRDFNRHVSGTAFETLEQKHV